MGKRKERRLLVIEAVGVVGVVGVVQVGKKKEIWLLLLLLLLLLEVVVLLGRREGRKILVVGKVGREIVKVISVEVEIVGGVEVVGVEIDTIFKS